MFLKSKIVIDLGSCYTKIFKSNADIVLYEPTLIIIDQHNYRKVVAVGNDAEKKIGKTTPNMQVIRPVNNASIVDEKALIALLEAFIKKIKTPTEPKPNVILSVQLGIDRRTIKAFEQAFNKAGLYNLEFVETPVLSLLGVNAPIGDFKSSFLIDFGSSQTTICALTLEGVISGVSIDIGGDNLNQRIQQYLQTNYDLDVPDNQIEKLKNKIASLVENDRTNFRVNGKSYTTSKPKMEYVTASQIYEPIKSFIDDVIGVIDLIIKKLPNETLIETQNNGIFLTGGGSKIYGLTDYLFSKLQIKTNFDYQGELASILGGGIVLNNKKLLQKIRLQIN